MSTKLASVDEQMVVCQHNLKIQITLNTSFLLQYLILIYKSSQDDNNKIGFIFGSPLKFDIFDIQPITVTTTIYCIHLLWFL